MKPFLRWAGGKARVARRLASEVCLSGGGRYFEPFLGAGSVFFSVNPSKAILSDANGSLIDCYRAVRDYASDLAGYVEELKRDCSRETYYLRRKHFNSASLGGIERAGLFIYLNRLCYNGVWRVNRHGEFNVPYGRRSPP
jgi:DNA adenine methylase